jgi:hypothetical protein
MKKTDIALSTVMIVGAFFSGVVMAPAFGGSDKVKDGFEIASFIATISVAVIAAFSLSIWRDQWKYNARQEALRRLHNSIEDLLCVEIYLKAYAWYKYSLRAYTNPTSVESAKEIEERAHLDLKQAVKDFASSLQDVHLLVQDYPFSEFLKSSQKIHSKIIQISQEVDSVFQADVVAAESAIMYSSIASKALMTEIRAASLQVFELRKREFAAR